MQAGVSLSLENKVALITGGSRGIGRVTAMHLLANGWFVADAHLVWLGGPEVLEALADNARKVPVEDALFAVEQLGIFKHPAVVRIMAVLAKKPASKQAATAWLAEHPQRILDARAKPSRAGT